MIVYKFGGASIKDAEAIIKMSEILRPFKNNIVVVISAMGKMTNLLEQIISTYLSKKDHLNELAKSFISFHYENARLLFDSDDEVWRDLDDLSKSFMNELSKAPSENYDFEYDKIVCFGELFSTKIVSYYLNKVDIQNTWTDVRQNLKTDNNYRDANINIELSKELVVNNYLPRRNKNIVITQGFIASDAEGNSTTLGREGSDYTAALFASFLNAEKVVVWKDVPGIMNADPTWYKNAICLPKLSYKETIELAYYGAKVIHPKTIKPLQNKSIPLEVKSFVNPKGQGTKIYFEKINIHQPLFILKENQILLSVSQVDFSFVLEESLSTIYKIFAEHNTRINMMQHSAVSFTVCCDNDIVRIPGLIDALKQEFIVLYNTDVTLLTIRHYRQNAEIPIVKGCKILIEQRSRNTVQIVFK